MTLNPRLAIFVACLAALPFVAAAAQTNSNMENGARETGPATSTHVEGATGKTIVPGNESTIHSDKSATRREQTGTYQRQ